MKNRILKILVLIYLAIVVALSLYLFMYNSLGTSGTKNYTVFSAQDMKHFKSGSLVIAKKYTDIKENDKIVYYNFYTNKNKILDGKVSSFEKTNENETTYLLDSGRFVSSSYLISNKENCLIIPLLGYIFSILTSTWGYLLFATIPTLVLFIYQLHKLIKDKEGVSSAKKN